MSARIVIVGGGEHARVVAEAAELSGLQLEGYLDRDATSAVIPNVPRLGDDDSAAELARTGSTFVLGIGGLADSAIRRGVAERYESIDATWATVIHPSAVVSPAARVQAGSFIGAGAVVNSGARVGRHAIVNTGALIEHDVEIGDHAIIGPGVTIGGGTVVEAGAVLGLGASLRDHITIGAGTVVGMGSVVTQSTRPGFTVMGVPAREVGDGD